MPDHDPVVDALLEALLAYLRWKVKMPPEMAPMRQVPLAPLPLPREFSHRTFGSNG